MVPTQPGRGRQGHCLSHTGWVSSSFCVLPSSAIQFHQLLGAPSSLPSYGRKTLQTQQCTVIQTLMVVLISTPQRWWQLWSVAQGSETLLGCSWRKNREAGAGGELWGKSPRAHSPTSGLSRLRLRAGRHEGTDDRSLFCYPSRSIFSKTSHPRPSRNLRPHEVPTHTHAISSGQARVWPWSCGETLN